MSTLAATEFKSAARIQGSITAAREKQLLVWLARRTPAWINADHLTLLGFSGQVLAGASLALARWDHRALWLATFFIVVNWLGDSLDGTLARVRNQ